MFMKKEVLHTLALDLTVSGQLPINTLEEEVQSSLCFADMALHW